MFVQRAFLASVFIFIGKVALTALNIFTLMGILKLTTGDDDAKSILSPCIFVGVCTFITATLILGMLETVAQAQMTCVGIDRDLNNGY